MIIKENYLKDLVLPETVDSVRNRRLNRAVPGKTALLILDMQDFFVSEDSHAWVPDAASVVSPIETLRMKFVEMGLPVIFTRHVNREENAGNMGVWWRDILKADNPYSEFTPGIEVNSSSVIEKSQYDAFYRTDLDDILKREGVESLVISGVMTHLCCETTARSGFVKGYKIFFGIDLTATYNREFHNATMINIAHGFGLPVYSNEIVDLLEKRIKI